MSRSLHDREILIIAATWECIRLHVIRHCLKSLEVLMYIHLTAYIMSGRSIKG